MFLRIIKNFLIFSLLLIILLITINFYNYFRIKPSVSEIKSINNLISNSIIIDTNDIKIIQNLIIDSIKHFSNNNGREINIDSIIVNKEGSCFDRSLLLQKILIMNNFKIRPIYLYKVNIDDNSLIKFFSKKLPSHNTFEVFINKKWYLIRTNEKIKNFETLESYIKDKKLKYNINYRYIKFLNNRNGAFVYPSFIPDIYGFF
jgi:hypothetical protein